MRTKPYTARGLWRVPCARCGRPSTQQWQICADGNQWRGLCNSCDVGVNALVMRYVFGDTREEAIAAYAAKINGEAVD